MDQELSPAEWLCEYTRGVHSYEVLKAPGIKESIPGPEVQCTPDGKYLMDFIDDRQVYAAVMLARRLISEDGQDPVDACDATAKRYGVALGDVSSYVAQVAERMSRQRTPA